MEWVDAQAPSRRRLDVGLRSVRGPDNRNAFGERARKCNHACPVQAFVSRRSIVSPVQT